MPLENSEQSPLGKKVIKKNITGATPSQIIEMLCVYKEAVQTPFDSLPHILKAFDKSIIHLLVIAVKKDCVHIEYADSITHKDLKL
jgi:hypothetical protein